MDTNTEEESHDYLFGRYEKRVIYIVICGICLIFSGFIAFLLYIASLNGNRRLRSM